MIRHHPPDASLRSPGLTTILTSTLVHRLIWPLFLLALAPATVTATTVSQATLAPAAGGEPPLLHSDEQNLVLLEVRLGEYVLTEAIPGYQFGHETFLPLGELARLLTLAITIRPDQGAADGFVLSEARSFSLNVAQSRVTLAGQSQSFDPALVSQQGDEIYVASPLLAQWLPVDFDVDMSRLILQVKPRERLPLQERLERERMAGKAGVRTAHKEPAYPRHAIPYRMLGVPFIDQTLGVGLRAGNGREETTANYSAYLAGDLLGMESELFFSANQQEPQPEVRFTLARRDPDAGLLGPLHARTVVFGSGVAMPSVANVVSRTPTGTGYGVSNHPLTQPTSFDRHTLQGDLPPGWDVELYVNEALVGFQMARTDGRYLFEDQPLAYGANDFRLVFHGPLGQQRVEKQSFFLEQSTTPPGAFYYNLGQHQDNAGQRRSVAQFEWGLSKYLAATAGVVSLPVLDGAGANSADGQQYRNVGLRAFWRTFIVSNDFFSSSNGGWLNESGLKTRLGRVSLSYSLTQLNDFSSELFLPGTDPLRWRDKVRLDSAILSGWLPRLRTTLEWQRDQFQSGSTNLALSARVAGYLQRTSVSNQLTWQTSTAITTASGALQASRRVGVIGLNGQLSYSLEPQARLESLMLSADKLLHKAYLLNMGVVRSVSGHETLYTAGLNKSLGSYGLGLSTSYSSSGVFALGLQLFMGMSREPRQPQWRFDAQPKPDRGSASVLVFMDNNGNGVMDSGDAPIENAAITVNGSRAPAQTDAAGIAWLDRLPIRQYVDIAVDAQTLEDPYWQPQLKGVSLVPRPGHVAELDFAVILTSEIDGTVYLVEKTSRTGIGDVMIELLDADYQRVTAIKTSWDGYYLIPAVARGHYYLRVSPEQLKQFDLIDPGVREITILPDGKFISGADFWLRKKPAETEPDHSRE